MTWVFERTCNDLLKLINIQMIVDEGARLSLKRLIRRLLSFMPFSFKHNNGYSWDPWQNYDIIQWRKGKNRFCMIILWSRSCNTSTFSFLLPFATASHCLLHQPDHLCRLLRIHHHELHVSVHHRWSKCVDQLLICGPWNRPIFYNRCVNEVSCP